MNQILQYLASRKFDVVSDETYSHINEWLSWYQNDVSKFHKYKVYNGSVTTSHERYRLGMAKKVCEDWANLLLNEKAVIKAGSFDETLHKVLSNNNFDKQANQLIEKAFALGTGAFVEYLDADDNVIIDYLRADMIYPLSWDNGDIIECAFGTTRVFDGEEVIYLQIHRYGRKEDEEDPSAYYIENRYVNAKSGEEIEPPEEIEELVRTGYDKPLFQILKPNISNNIDMDSPLGISVYANSIDQLKGCDLTYDSYINEFVLGRKRILVPISAAKMQMEKDGVATPTFDAKDTVYYMMPGDRSTDMSITEIDMNIRASEHELGIQRMLDLLSFKCGMGTGRFRFESSGVKTATEVISDKSDLFQNRQKNTIIIESVIKDMVKAIAFLSGAGDVEVTVNFDDSIIEDINTVIDRNIKLTQAGLRSKVTAIMEITHCSEADAKKELEKIIGESQVGGSNIDWTDNENDDDDEVTDEQIDEPTNGGGDRQVVS